MNERHPDEARLNAYLLDDLEPAERREVHAHLQNCPACRRLADTLQAVLAAYRDDAPAVADEAGLVRLLAARRSVPPRRSRWTMTALVAASTAAIFLGGFWTGRSDVLRPEATPTGSVPMIAEKTTLQPRHHEPPIVTFAVADADLLGGSAPRDTTWN